MIKSKDNIKFTNSFKMFKKMPNTLNVLSKPSKLAPIQISKRMFINKNIRQKWSNKYEVRRRLKRFFLRNVFWYRRFRTLNRVIPKALKIKDERKTVRNSSFSSRIFHNFSKLISYSDLPYNFNLRKYKLIRYSAMFYGHNYQRNFFSYNLWLTMGLKKNIAVPFGFFYKTNNPRWNYLSSLNVDSWKNYVYLIKDSFIKPKTSVNILNTDISTNFYQSNSQLIFNELSDISNWIRRKRFKFHRPISLSHDDLDFSISTYHAKFDYYDLRTRSSFFWIANNSIFRETAFFISSFDTSVTLYPQRYFWYMAFWPFITKYYKSWYFMNNVVKYSPTLNVNIVKILQSLIFNNYIDNFTKFININDKLFYIYKLFIYKLFILFKIKRLKKLNYIFFNNYISVFNKTFNISNLNSLYYFQNNINFKNNNLKSKLLLNMFTKYRNAFNNIIFKKLKSLKRNKMPKLFNNNFLKNGFKQLLIQKFKQLHLNKITKRFKKIFRTFKSFNIKKNFNIKRFKFLNIHRSSEGFLKVRFVRARLAKGYDSYSSVGLRHALNLKKKTQIMRRYKNIIYKYKFKPVLLKNVTKFLKGAFEIIFIISQKNLNLSFNFLNTNFIEGFYFQLYFLLFKLFNFYKLHLNMPERCIERSFKKNTSIYNFFLKHKFKKGIINNKQLLVANTQVPSLNYFVNNLKLSHKKKRIIVPKKSPELRKQIIKEKVRKLKAQFANVKSTAIRHFLIRYRILELKSQAKIRKDILNKRKLAQNKRFMLKAQAIREDRIRRLALRNAIMKFGAIVKHK